MNLDGKRGRSEWVTTKVSAPRDALMLYCFTASERRNGIIQGSCRRLEHEKNLFKRRYVLLDLWNSFPLCNEVPGCRVKKARLHFVSHLWPLICGAAVSCCFSTWHSSASPPVLLFWLLEQIKEVIWWMGRPCRQTLLFEPSLMEVLWLQRRRWRRRDICLSFFLWLLPTGV